MKQLLLMLVLFVVGSAVVAQTRTISGRVTDSDTGEGLPGVTISVKGTTSGTATDLDGNFSLSVSGDETLVVSYIGYVTQEIAVAARTVFDISLSADVAELSEVVIVGYGQTTLQDATGSVAAVTSKDFNGGVIASPEQLIQGKTAGVQITSNSGAPGAGVQLRIRGTNSVRSNNNPLFVVDGVPLAGDNTSDASANVGFGTGGNSNPLNFINPSDIESISILKDASSAAIYGSRGANGVVFIKTKSGKGNKGTLEYSTQASISSPQNTYDLLGREEFLAGVAQFGGNAAEQDLGNDTDWQDFLFRTSFSHAQNLSYSKGFSTGSVRASFGYEDQQGIIEDSSLERITGRINGTKSFLNDDLNISLQSTFTRTNEQLSPISGSAGFRGDLLGATYSANPTWPEDIESLSEAEITNTIGGQTHPGNLLANFQGLGEVNRQLINVSVDYKILDELTAKVTYGFDNSNAETTQYLTGNARNVDRGVTGRGRGGFSELDTRNNLVEATLTYDADFGNSKLNIVGGFSYQDFNRSGLNAELFGYQGVTDFGLMDSNTRLAVDQLDGIRSSLGGFIQQIGYASNTGLFANRLLPTIETITPTDITTAPIDAAFIDYFDFTDELMSFFGRANYTLNDKYLVTFTLRTDGSSRFSEDNRFGVFPSGAVAWKIHEEDFFSSGLLSELKFRLGYGITGNQDGLGYGSYVRRERYVVGGANDNNVINDDGEIVIPGTAAVANRNPDLKWEETAQFSAGLDFGAANGRLSGSLDFYSKVTSDLLLQIQAAQPALTEFVFTNLEGAEVVNSGFEVQLDYDVINSGDLLFNISGNYAYNQNELRDFAGAIPAGTIRGQGLSEAFAQILIGNEPLFSYFLRPFDGFDPTSGQPLPDGAEQQLVGKSALPTSNAGLSFNVTYKNWDFSTYLAGQFGFYVYNNTANAFFTAGAINNARNVTPDVLTSGEAGSAAAEVSERFLEKGDFIRMQNLSIGYNFDTDGKLFKNLRVFFNAQNLFLITDYSGLDPEVNVQPSQVELFNDLPTAGIDYTAYPRPRTFTLGANISF